MFLLIINKSCCALHRSGGEAGRRGERIKLPYHLEQVLYKYSDFNEFPYDAQRKWIF